MSDIYLDPTTGDLAVTNGELTLTEGADAVAQYLRQKMKTYFGEWFLDQSVGLPYTQQIFDKVKDPVALDALFKKAILETPGVIELTAYSLTLDSTTREATLTFEARSTEGPITFNETLG